MEGNPLKPYLRFSLKPCLRCRHKAGYRYPKKVKKPWTHKREFSPTPPPKSKKHQGRKER